MYLFTSEEHSSGSLGRLQICIDQIRLADNLAAGGGHGAHMLGRAKGEVTPLFAVIFRELLPRESKKTGTPLLPITTPNADRFSKKITIGLGSKLVMKMIIKDPTAPQTYRCTTL